MRDGEDKVRLGQDARDKLVVEIERGSLVEEIRGYFRWRKGDFIERLNKMGTSERDKFIEYLDERGY